MSPAPLRVAVFASGGGSNLQALIDHRAAPPADDVRGHGWEVSLLVTNRPCGAIERAAGAGVETALVPSKGRSETEMAEALDTVLRDHGIDVVLLAGYLRLMPAAVVERYRGRILNIHPALLPDFGGKGMYGMNVHRAVLEAGVDTTGPTVHFVDAVYDSGAILAQAHVPVLPDDTPEEIAARVLAVEHRLYPLAVDHLCAALSRGEHPEPLGLVTLPESLTRTKG